MKKLQLKDSSNPKRTPNRGVRNSKKGMELVQVGILIGIAVFLGLIFKTQIGDFINNVFTSLMGAGF
jgi:hypothetical protein